MTGSRGYQRVLGQGSVAVVTTNVHVHSRCRRHCRRRWSFFCASRAVRLLRPVTRCWRPRHSTAPRNDDLRLLQQLPHHDDGDDEGQKEAKQVNENVDDRCFWRRYVGTSPERSGTKPVSETHVQGGPNSEETVSFYTQLIICWPIDILSPNLTC